MHSLNPTQGTSLLLHVAAEGVQASGEVLVMCFQWDLVVGMGLQSLLFTPAWTVVVTPTLSCHCAVSVSHWRHHPWHEVLSAGRVNLWQMSLLWSQKAWAELVSWQSHWLYLSLTMTWVQKPYPCRRRRRRCLGLVTGGWSLQSVVSAVVLLLQAWGMAKNKGGMDDFVY